jgi:hypothetical protein
MEDGFKEFKVTVPKNRRYWEDDTTGVLIKQGQTVTIAPRQFRSAELKSALLKSQVLVCEGECRFVYKENQMKISPGNEVNTIEVIAGPEFKIKETPIEIKEIPKEEIKVNEENENGKKIRQHSVEPTMRLPKSRATSQ